MKSEEFDLMHRYLDGAITPEELGALEELLRTNAEARATLRSLATVDAKWQQLAVEEASTISDQFVVSRPSRTRAIRAWLALGVMAASLMIGVWGWFRGTQANVIQVERGIARVIRVEGEGLVDNQRVITAGADLFAGEELVLTQGLVELAFRESGVHVIATAPLQVALESDERVSLTRGQIKLVVPPQGVGFVVDTAQRRFTDLGTSFVVTASSTGSEVLVLDGLISIDDHDGTTEDLLHEGGFARYDRDGKLNKRTPSHVARSLPELALAATDSVDGSLRGDILGFDKSIAKERLADDVIGSELLPLIGSEFRDRACLEAFKQGQPLSFRGIAGAFHQFPDRTGLAPYFREGGWLTWYRGQVLPPRTGRYRFWGYADNHLLVAINGKPVFEGSRRDSSFKALGIPRTDNPALPCLIARAGFACSEWIALGDKPVRIDILFGEVGGNITSGLLLVEREGDVYEETFWGQPKWPLFLTASPSAEEVAEFKRLVNHLEQKTMGSFSIEEDAIWKVQN